MSKLRKETENYSPATAKPTPTDERSITAPARNTVEMKEQAQKFTKNEEKPPVDSEKRRVRKRLTYVKLLQLASLLLPPALTKLQEETFFIVHRR